MLFRYFVFEESLWIWKRRGIASGDMFPRAALAVGAQRPQPQPLRYCFDRASFVCQVRCSVHIAFYFEDHGYKSGIACTQVFFFFFYSEHSLYDYRTNRRI